MDEQHSSPRIFDTRGTLAQDVEAHLEKMIIEGQLEPDERLVPEVLAKQFGLSKSPVREALTRLQKEGLVRSQPRIGFFVAQIDLADIEDIYPIRASLNGLLVKTLIERGYGDDFIPDLENILAEMEAKCEADDVAAYFDLNVRFYKFMQSSCHNHHLTGLINQLGKMVLRFRYLSLSQPGHCRRSLLNHQSLVASLKKRDVAAATKMVQVIIDNALDVLRDYFREKEPRDV